MTYNSFAYFLRYEIGWLLHVFSITQLQLFHEEIECLKLFQSMRPNGERSPLADQK
jgi:hypothetical protein